MADTSVKCANEPCTCSAPTGEAYCSPYCEHAATSGPPRRENVCDCGHEDCAGQ